MNREEEHVGKDVVLFLNVEVVNCHIFVIILCISFIFLPLLLKLVHFECAFLTYQNWDGLVRSTLKLVIPQDSKKRLCCKVDMLAAALRIKLLCV